jgi:hypothetical protein
MVLDAQRVLADEVLLKLFDDAVHGGGVPPAGRLPDPGYARVGGDAQGKVTAEKKKFKLVYLHGAISE